MNHQSDYGYTTGGIEYRDAETCAQRVKQCEGFAEQYPQMRDVFLSHAEGWRREAETYRKLETRKGAA